MKKKTQQQQTPNRDSKALWQPLTATQQESVNGGYRWSPYVPGFGRGDIR
ncbi:hypothetical protein [Leptothoe kymatousa]|uniref:Uncharacterized protein n=1 Tax=Leptothoe kymatousa TAU-MAC 1615 TaxID=2364775 RepID=A0ABS5Y5L1_9CYAN|nr:hypothetical protein [Leptothoe kymatousa]MBT9312265.1 hypothetical protein [Leptothoe kymatousa TAU-MAC 1615]